MTNNFYHRIWGTAVLVMAFSSLTSFKVQAQSCIKTPTCAELGFAQSASDCNGKTMLKCPLDTSKVYCPSDQEYAKTYNIGDVFVDFNGIALGRVITLTDGGKHGRIMASTPYFITDYSRATTICLDKTTGRRAWYMATGSDLFNNRSKWGSSENAKGIGIVGIGCYWSSTGCCHMQSNGSTESTPCFNSCFSCGYKNPEEFKEGWAVYCVTDF